MALEAFRTLMKPLEKLKKFDSHNGAPCVYWGASGSCNWANFVITKMWKRPDI